MGWWREASRGAAHEFGRRHYRLFAGAALLRSTWRVLLVAVVLIAVVAGGWVLLHRGATGSSVAASAGLPDGTDLIDLTAAWVKPTLVVAGVVLVLIVTRLVWRRWGVILRMYWPLGDAAAVALYAGLLLGGAAAAWVLLP
ncbi:hypothetical protein ACQEVZ_60635 [Dactylosporangium sp. CA-152071]|uniref:hypothetical protein n=1 Tax=Dactylosporangium sp. CA-152071 TaxID=3239933 RepID=UPI003D8A3479